MITVSTFNLIETSDCWECGEAHALGLNDVLDKFEVMIDIKSCRICKS